MTSVLAIAGTVVVGASSVNLNARVLVGVHDDDARGDRLRDRAEEEREYRPTRGELRGGQLESVQRLRIDSDGESHRVGLAARRRLERGFEVLDQVFGRLNAHRESNKAVVCFARLLRVVRGLIAPHR